MSIGANFYFLVLGPWGNYQWEEYAGAVAPPPLANGVRSSNVELPK